ncbi:MAG: hypothetical protein RLZZ488_1078 [Pseudomonadota bacterium]
MGLIQVGTRQLRSMTIAALITASVMSACKKQQTSDAETESSSGSGTVVSGFVTREHGYLDTAVGRKHMVSMAARIGIKRLFVDVWSRGCTLFKSSVMKSHGGPEICAESEGDPLGDLMRYGKQYNIEIVPWFEWGNIVPAKSALWNKNKNRGWSGFEESFHTVPSIRINPYKGDFGLFFADLLKEVVSRYGAREIHLCDNFAPHTKYGSATAIKGAQAFTAAALKITAPARNAGAVFSLSSQRRLNSLQTFSIDWSRWLRSGVVKWVYPQLYHVSESKTEQFLSEARAEKAAGAIGVALYTGPTTARWTLEGVGKYVKLARTLGLESAIFDFNTLLADQKASNNTHVQKISQALGTRMRYGLSDATQPPQPAKPPQAPILPPPDEQSPVAPVLPPPDAVPPVATPDAQISPTPKTRLCEYMKVVGAPESGAPAYLSAGKGEAVDSAFNEQLAYRHLTQNSSDGSEMMYVTLYSADGGARVRWLEAKYLAERRPEEQICSP